MNYLSKSDFKVARQCATKLYYRKLRYPSTVDDDPYMELLADGGFMVGKFAQILYPEGVMVANLDPASAVAETTSLLKRNEVTLFEAAFFAGGMLGRVDVLRKNGNRIELIEVKSKGFDPAEGIRGARGGILSSWMEYIEDVAFQKLVVQLAIPTAEIECFLLVTDKSAPCELDELPAQFEIKRAGRTVEVDHHGDPAVLRRSKLLRLVPVDDEVAEVLPTVRQVASSMVPYIINGPQRAAPVIGYKCRECVYRTEATEAKNGFRECWGALANVHPSILELFQLGRVKGPGDQKLADHLIVQKKASLFDVPESALKGGYAERQKVQIRSTRQGTEWRSPQLRPLLERLEYPLHFIDFETSRLALPYHVRMRPYEQVAFQWSCHSLEEPGADLKHSEWINVAASFPNIQFAETLRAAVGSTGTLLTWSHHEATTLKDIARQIGDYEPSRADLIPWLTAAAGRTFDLCKHAGDHYFHPEMKGSTSIKYVLPAVWKANRALRQHPWFSKFAKQEDGEVINPYRTLPPLEIYDRSEVVDEGTGAMRAYQEMVYGSGRHEPAVRDTWKSLLLQYCGLDTLAMVIIWKHWVD